MQADWSRKPPWPPGDISIKDLPIRFLDPQVGSKLEQFCDVIPNHPGTISQQFFDDVAPQNSTAVPANPDFLGDIGSDNGFPAVGDLEQELAHILENMDDFPDNTEIQPSH